MNDILVSQAAAIIRPYLRSTDRMFLFGSRTTTAHHRYSDIDIGIENTDHLPADLLFRITDALEASDLPVRVDVVDFSHVSETFKRIAKQSMIAL